MLIPRLLRLYQNGSSFGNARLLSGKISVPSVSKPENFTNIQHVPRSKVEFLAKMMFMPHQSPPDSRLLKIAVVGFPNAGKSSLVNMLANWRVCAVSGKAHTTRSKQTVVFTKGNIQLAFVDLPGLVSARKIRQFNLERTFIRDPHSAIFEADLVLVVVDASNKYAKVALDPEILKVLHFFPDKESVLVLNKTDLLRGDPTCLLDTTRRLTGGVVGHSTDSTNHGPGSPRLLAHLDAFANKYARRARLEAVGAPSAARGHLSVEAIIFPRLPPAAHKAAQARLDFIAQLTASLPPPVQIESAAKEKSKKRQLSIGSGEGAGIRLLQELTTEVSSLRESVESTETGEKHLAPVVESNSHSTFEVKGTTSIASTGDGHLNSASQLTSSDLSNSSKEAITSNHQSTHLVESEPSSSESLAPTDRQVTQVEVQVIEEFFSTFTPSKPTSPSDLHQADTTALKESLNVEQLESLVEQVRTQMMLKSATPEEVALRRQQWRELGVSLQGVKHWEGFSRVFMVSSATGDGIDLLRNYLLERAKPGRNWVLSPALVTDVEPSELIRMCVWAHCLDQLPQEVPYGITVAVDECEAVNKADGDDRVYVHCRLRCPNERSIKFVIGARGDQIKSIARAVKQELSGIFQAPTVVKLTAEMIRPSRGSMKRLRAAKDFAEVFPNFDNTNAGPGLSQYGRTDSAQV